MSGLKRPPTLAAGHKIRFEGQVRGVLEVTAQAAVVEDAEAPHRVVALLDLFEAADFEVLFQPERMPLPPVGLLEAFPPEAVKQALWWEGHILEVLHGIAPGGAPATEPRPGYGPGSSVTSRERVKAAELAVAGHDVAAKTIATRRRRYQEHGLVGLADRRPVRRRAEFGSIPEAVVEAMRKAIREGVDTSTRNGAYLIWRTGEILRESGGEPVELPARRTLYRLLAKLTKGTHATGSAVTRRSKAHGAAAPFGELTVSAPGEVMQIDSTPLDVMVRLDNGVLGKVELTGMIDVATRTLSAAVLRPTTKSVDASVLLARTVTPELMRPGWVEALKMSRSVLPHRRLLTLDERLEHAAAKPVIVPAWRAVNSYGIRINNRTYDSPELGPMRLRDSGVTAKRGLWEVHRDPYAVSYVWVRDHRGDGGWVQATWKYLNRAPVPFGDLAWDHVSHQLPRATEEELAQAVADLLTRAHAGPDRPAAKKDRKTKPAKGERQVAARTKAAPPTVPSPAPQPPRQPEAEAPAEDDDLAEVIPLGLFNPLEDPWGRS
ncbi:integrase [Streptomyces xanthochromogenes]|uniref:integrase n=1 Tax=Streptomyces xanthochromogenes TaxID=67384 RepID=UPI00379A2640